MSEKFQVGAYFDSSKAGTEGPIHDTWEKADAWMMSRHPFPRGPIEEKHGMVFSDSNGNYWWRVDKVDVT